MGGGILATGHTTSTSNESADQLFTLLWDLQAVPEEKGPLSPEEQSSVTQYQDSYTRLQSGQYSVPLSGCSPVQELEESQTAALKHFLQNKRSFKCKGQWEVYDSVLHKNTTLGHAERVPSCDLFKPSSDHFYLPMHGVVKNSSKTTKLRVVFDASAKTTSSFSLNNQLLAEPSLYPNLSTVISKFRCHRVVITGDTSKMYHGILIHAEEKDYHRFLKCSPTGQIEDWRMLCLTLGVAFSLYLATQVLHQAGRISTLWPLT